MLLPVLFEAGHPVTDLLHQAIALMAENIEIERVQLVNKASSHSDLHGERCVVPAEHPRALGSRLK